MNFVLRMFHFFFFFWGGGGAVIYDHNNQGVVKRTEGQIAPKSKGSGYLPSNRQCPPPHSRGLDFLIIPAPSLAILVLLELLSLAFHCSA